MINKLKKIFRILFSKALTPLEILHHKIFNESIKEILQVSDSYQVVFKNNIKVSIRNEKHSDINVFHQIFVLKEYELVQNLMALNKGFSKQKNIIDAGANVGYTTVFLSNIFQDASIYAIEPSNENAKIFFQNINDLKNKSKIKLYQKALAHKPNLTFEIDRNFRDGKDWSIATNEIENGTIQGISISEIITENNLFYISLLKIDIEGAERFIFKPENDLSFLEITEVIAMEIHDEFEIRETIYDILKNNNFLLFESGELIIGVNQKLYNAQ